MVSAAAPVVEAPIVARFEYREADIVAAFREMQGRTPHVFAAMGVALLGLVAWGEHRVNGLVLDLLRDPVFLVLMLAFALSAMHVLVWAPRRFARQMVRKMGGPVTFELDEKGMGMSSELWTSRFAWGWFDRVRETRTVIVLHPDNQLAFVLPKDSLAPGDLERVRALLRRNLRYDGP